MFKSGKTLTKSGKHYDKVGEKLWPSLVKVVIKFCQKLWPSRVKLVTKLGKIVPKSEKNARLSHHIFLTFAHFLPDLDTIFARLSEPDLVTIFARLGHNFSPTWSQQFWPDLVTIDVFLRFVHFSQKSNCRFGDDIVRTVYYLLWRCFRMCSRF